MANKNVTLSIDEDVYKSYKEYCLLKAIALSKSIENFMRNQLSRNPERRTDGAY